MRYRNRNIRVALIPALLGLSFSMAAADLREPLTISSEHGVLDLLMVAKAAPITTIRSKPVAWVYEICQRPAANIDTCSQDESITNYYGGTLLKLRKGDVLKIHLVNQLPLALDSAHAEEEEHQFLRLNPTNIHTHGMLVAPRAATPENPTWGDNVFVLTFNSANGKPEMSPHMHSEVRYDWTDYQIKVPANHPSGLYWFHPHAHGVSLNQISAGLSGLIAVGDISDYLCKNGGCGDELENMRVRQMILKDTQVLPDNSLQSQQDPDFCREFANPSDGSRKGSCKGQDLTGEGGANYSGGRWFFTINGQVYPSVRVASSAGEIWRVTNASGSATYDLQLWSEQQKRSMLFQIVSLDGVSVSPGARVDTQEMRELAANKFVPEACPGSEASMPAPQAICTRTLHMMPSSRAEVWVTYRDASGRPVPAPAGSSAVFRTAGYQTGPSGDAWPQIDLAHVSFEARRPSAMPSRSPNTPAVTVDGEASALSASAALAKEFAAMPREQYTDSCRPLPPGHMRRIFYGAPTQDPDAFGLAYEEIDEHGDVVGTPATDVEVFDPMKPTICVSLGPNDAPAVERWQLVNVATEDHNFHIHQVKFRVVSSAELDQSGVPKGIVFDNMPLPHATGTCGNNPPGDLTNPIADWRAGLCHSQPITVEIPFSIAGDFVYHCHILEHEDGGMMARIRVRHSHK